MHGISNISQVQHMYNQVQRGHTGIAHTCRRQAKPGVVFPYSSLAVRVLTCLSRFDPGLTGADVRSLSPKGFRLSLPYHGHQPVFPRTTRCPPMRDDQFSSMMENVSTGKMSLRLSWPRRGELPCRKCPKKVSLYNILPGIDPTVIAAEVIQGLANFLAGLWKINCYS